MDRAADILTDAEVVATWDDVENYFQGPECAKCDYLRGYRNCEGTWVTCSLLKPWDGRGLEPMPSDCPGVEDV